MRPIVLKMTAFGPYKDTEVIDFRALEENRLFVISGATGAGKTTIFDGISFALYGQASGVDRANVRALRSHFADDRIQTSVELLFEVKNRMYRIYREVPYTKKGNKTETPANCHFYEIRNEEEIPVVDRQMVTEINKKIEALIGFTQAQFSQIVMLPQGEFRKFLTSDTENKELIMRKIFKTDQYRLLVTKLKEQRDDIQAKLQGEEQQKRALIDHIKTAIPTRNSALFNVLQQEAFLVEQVVDALGSERQFYIEEVAEAKQQYEQKFQQHEQLVKEYHAAKVINDQFDTLIAKNAHYQTLYAQIPHFTEQNNRISLGEQASAVLPIEERLLELQKETAAEKEAYTQCVEVFQHEKEKYEQIEKEYRFTEEQLPAFEEMKTERYHLQQLKPKIERLHEEQKQVETLQQTSAQLKERLDNVNKRFINHQQVIEQLEENIVNGEQATQSLDEQRESLMQLETICEKVDRYVEQSTHLKDAVQVKRASQVKFEEAQQVYEQMKRQWLVTEAVALAAELREGEACPVCGSMEHPKKAHAGEANVAEEELLDFEKKVQKCNEQYQFAVARVETFQQHLQEQQASLQALGVLTTAIENVQKEKHEERENLQQIVNQLLQRRQTLESLRQQLREEKQLETTLRTEKEQLTHHQLQQDERLKHLRLSVEQLSEEIPAEFKEIEHYTKSLQTVETKIEAFEQKKKQLQEVYEQQKQRYLTAENHASFKKLSLQSLEKKLHEGEEKFQQAIQEASFDSIDAYQQAKLDRETIQLLKKEIEQFRDQYHLVREEINELKEKLAGKERVDLQQVDVQLQSFKEAYEQALHYVNERQQIQKTIDQASQQLEQVVERTGKLDKKFGKVEELYNLIRGQNHAKLSFERYIQIEYLEQMLQSANERLHELSNGQFELLRSDRQEERGRQSGLGLDVYDAYTGQTRDVKTLSGGEKFNASLCLALGMSDIIQSFQGAVSIDTMFIDEGFGTLDEESLAKAIDTLIELQKSGRMIGVISHVEELKSAFPAILEVSKTREGYSKTSFTLK